MSNENAAGSIIGSVIGGRYRVTKLLGQGGMGEVFAAEHIHITKKVAVKLLHPEISNNAEAVARFKQEAQSASSIGHENIIRIDDFFELDGGRVCMCMEFLDGESLDTVIHDMGRNDPVRGIHAMCQVCDGLSAAHAKGIIHRDMKPENIFLVRTSDGSEQAKILDFGIAKVTGSDGHDLTKTGMVFGTPHYMSPEQALGHEVDSRADVYSLGVMLFEMFTGQVPFKAESFMGVLSQHITTPPPRPSTLTPTGKIPEPVEQLILKAMDKNPGNRFGSVSELRTALSEATVAFGGAPAASPAKARGGASTQVGSASPLDSAVTVLPGAGPAPGAAARDHGTAPTMASQQMMAKQADAPAMSTPPTVASARPVSQLADDNELQIVKSGRSKLVLLLVVVGVLIAGGAAALFVLQKKSNSLPAKRGNPVAAAKDTANASSSTTNGEEATNSQAPQPDAGASRTESLSGAPQQKTEDAGSAADVSVAVRVAKGQNDAGSAPAKPNHPVATAADARAAKPITPVVPPEEEREFYDVKVVSIPGDAAVFRGGRKLRRRTPIVLKLRPGQRVRLRLAKGGRKDKSITVVGKDEDQVVRVPLKRRSFGGAASGGDFGKDDFDGF